MLDEFAAGFAMALRLDTFAMMAFGLFGGMLVGALPGFTTTMAMAILLPISFFLDPIVGIPFLLGIYKGGIFGGSIPAILISMPGTGAAVATSRDGYKLTQKGKSRKALDIALFSSVFGDTSSDIFTILMIFPIAFLVMQFGPPELFAVLLLSLVIIAATSGGSPLKSLVMMLFGLWLSFIGTGDRPHEEWVASSVPHFRKRTIFRRRHRYLRAQTLPASRNSARASWRVLLPMLIGVFPAIPLFSRLVTIRVSILIHGVRWFLMFAFAGAFVFRSDSVDLLMLVVFGMFGIVAKIARFDVMPMVMGFILGPPLEYAFGQTIAMISQYWAPRNRPSGMNRR